MTLFKKNHFWRYNLHFMDHIPILIVLFWNIGMGHNLLFPYFGGITIHWPAILVYYPGTRVLSHRCHLVGGFKHFLFSIIYGIILPIDFHMFQDGWNHQPVIHSFIRSFIHSFIELHCSCAKKHVFGESRSSPSWCWRWCGPFLPMDLFTISWIHWDFMFANKQRNEGNYTYIYIYIDILYYILYIYSIHGADMSIFTSLEPRTVHLHVRTVQVLGFWSMRWPTSSTCSRRSVLATRPGITTGRSHAQMRGLW